MIDLHELTIERARKHLLKKDFTAVELAEAVLKKIEEENPKIFAYLEVFENVLEQAKRSDERIALGEAGELEGIPISVKDNILVKGERAGAASKVLEGHRAAYDSTVARKLKEAGAVIVGRNNMDEFAMGSSTQYSAYGVTRNPLDPERVPGGSSGGSAATVAMGGALGSLGSDTAGSVRQPASFCGLVGLKPTYGSVSRNGLIALGSSLDVIGPITKTVGDSKILFDLIKGKDPLDSTSVGEEDFERKKIGKPVIGIPKMIFDGGLSGEALEVFKKNIKRLLDLGHETQEVELPHLSYSVPVYYVILPAEASSNLARFDGVRYGNRVEGEDLLATYLKTRGEGFGTEVRRRIILGTYVLSAGYYDAYYNRAQELRGLIKSEFNEAFKDVDVIAMPTTPGPAFKIGERMEDPLKMYLEDVFTVPANLVGIPTITVPSGSIDLEGKSLPLGLQLAAPHMREDVLFELSANFLGQ